MQMIQGGGLRSVFKSHLSTFNRNINVLPEELIIKPKSNRILYKEIKDSHSIKYSITKTCLTKADNNAFNVLVFGPTGSGKSTIINNVFNQEICITGATAQSVTRDVKFYQGKTQIPYLNEDDSVSWNEKKLNVIDTIGMK